MTDYRTLYDEHGGFLWGYCYRLTGSASDAEDLVHDTFVRAIERPPSDTDRPWRPWLVRVATNMRHDAFRKQKVREYKGPWLPSPVETERDDSWKLDAVGRYEALESVSFAFLLALEALTAQQRAVLLLRDVYDYSVAETHVMAALAGYLSLETEAFVHREVPFMLYCGAFIAFMSGIIAIATAFSPMGLEGWLTGTSTASVALLAVVLALMLWDREHLEGYRLLLAGLYVAAYPYVSLLF